MRDGFQVVFHGGVDIQRIAARRTGDDLLHVAIGRMQQPSRLGGSQDAHRIGRALGAQIGAFERVHGDIHARILDAVGSLRAHRLADVQHGSLVALALPDDDIARHMDRFKGVSHGVNRGLVGGLGVALTHGAGGGDGRLLNHVDKIAQQVSFNAGWCGGEGRSAHRVAVPILHRLISLNIYASR